MLGFATKKLRSTRGATFSMALFLFLVCTIISAIVIASASTSVGVVSEQGKADQRYYSVNSAVNVFSSYMGDGVTLSSQQVKQQTGDTTSPSVSGVSVVTPGNDYGNQAFDDLLVALVSYGLYGTNDMADASTTLSSLPEEAWIMPFEQGWWKNGTKQAVTAQALITPQWQPTTGRGEKTFDTSVEVEGWVAKDGALYLEFRNHIADDAKPETDQYSTLVTLNFAPSSVLTSAGNTQTRTDSVDLSISSIEPGGRLP